jgi:nucleotide-binding universal stress UspA family protein
MSVIVVGVDGSAGARAALRWAFEEAKLRKASLQVVHAWTFVMHGVPATGMGMVPYPTAEDFAALEEAAREALDKALAEVVGEQTDVPIDAHVVKASPAQALVEAAANADLLVVGSRGHGGFAGLLLGSVSQQCAHHAPCPVVIVREQTT